MPSGCKEVVELVYHDQGKDKKVLFGAQHPVVVADAIQRARAAAGRRIAIEDETLAEQAAIEEAVDRAGRSRGSEEAHPLAPDSRMPARSVLPRR